MARICVAMSGGVDSSVAALLLRQEGHQLSGVNLRMFHNEDLGESREKTCCSLADAEDAAQVARRLGFPFYVFDFAPVFRDTVIRDFIEAYQRGRTPNPCVECNRAVKFGALLDRVRVLGNDFLATGHYARVERDGASGRYLLKRGVDRSKDQSYFLYMLTQDQLAHTLFPLGGLHKTQVREIAETHGLATARKHDSQDICFVPDGKYADFIERTCGQPAEAGPFLDQEGRELGQHKGLIRYTRGQHKGLGISTEEPLYVLEKDVERNAIRLGPDSALWSRELTAEEVNWISIPELTGPMAVTAKTRYSQREAAAVAEPLSGGRLRVLFEEPQRAVTAGQAVVLYDGENVVGGGTICG
ncbi:tRNA 2-thiouridine(34) synthase MnmA [uncultured Dysosmobacter sp.]|uniref:tRNA 2-thiouridine(34) synthase MnmA n=1 Tax=uncultured Dysosmobacter sp. TaxID=2591384 RepID=UPI002614DFAA|nr:tRNA 2-thiouridine(34) synthase MnmA [uncultured Dysosmobacter sp.]